LEDVEENGAALQEEAEDRLKKWLVE